MSEEIVKQENPWDVSNIQEFLYYNCPECDTRVKDSQLFIQHALDNHELSKSYLNKTVVEIVSVSQNQDDSISDHEIEEIKERKPTQEELAFSDKNFMALKLHKLKVEPDVVLKVPDLKIRIQAPDQDDHMDYQPQPEEGSDSDSDFALPAEDEDDVKPDEPFFCDMCDKFFTTAQGLKWHITTKHIPKADRLNEQCDMCSLKCTNAQALKRHEVANHFEAVQCDTCDYKCHSKRMLQKHIKNKSKRKCEQCDAAYGSNSLMARHMKEKHFNSVLCDKCDYKCHSKLMLESHKITYHKIRYRYDVDSDGTFTCRVCKFQTQSEEEIKDHHWQHPDIKWRYKCELCEATFTHKYMYEEHKDVVHLGKIPYKCDQCDFTSKHRSELVKHKKRIHEKIPTTHICPVCGKCVTMLKQHMEALHPENDEGGTCDQCGMFFERKHLLKSHTQHHHTRKFQVCTICDKFFMGAKKQKLIDHYTDEHGIFCNKKNIYVCHICKIKATSNKELSEHYTTVHETKETFNCTKCDHNEATKALLSIHCIDRHNMNPFNSNELVNEKTVQGIQVAEDDKAYRCPICSKKLTSKVTLNNHIKQVHDKTNHVKCELCPRTFNYPSELKKHVLCRHTAPTKFPCSQCSYVTNHKSSLNQHFRKVHEKKYKYKCTVCERPFEMPNRLQEHMLREHDILYKY